MFLALLQEIRKSRKSGRLYQPNSQKLERVGSPGDVFSLALESKIASKSNGLVVKMNGKNNYKRKERKRQKRFCRFFLLGGRCE